MILVDWQIKDRIERGFIKIDPYDPKFVQPNSLDIRLGDHFVWYEEGTTVIDPFEEGTITSQVSEKHAEYIDIPPGMFLLAETFEQIELPDNIVATIEGKSSIATLEISNANQRPVRLYAKMPIGQLVFYTTERAEFPYGSKGDAKYLDQKQATLSRYHRNPKMNENRK